MAEYHADSQAAMVEEVMIHARNYPSWVDEFEETCLTPHTSTVVAPPDQVFTTISLKQERHA